MINPLPPVRGPRPAAPARAATPADPTPVPAPGERPDGEAITGRLSVKRRFWSFFRPTYDVTIGGVRVGTIRRDFSFTPRWELLDASGARLGEMRQQMLTFGFTSTIADAAGQRVGTIEQDIGRSLLEPTAVLAIKDGQGRLVARTDPAWLSHTSRIELLAPDGGRLGSYEQVPFSFGETSSLELASPLDRRLVLGFLASQLEVQAQEADTADADD